MKWSAGGRGNIEDRRGMGVRGGMSLGIGGVLVLAVLSWATGTDFLSLLNDGGGVAPATEQGRPGEIATSPAEERTVEQLCVD